MEDGSVCTVRNLSKISQFGERHELDRVSEGPIARLSLPNPLADQGHEGLFYRIVEDLGNILGAVHDVTLIRYE